VNVIANSRVPKITVIVGGSYGAGNYAMCGKAFDPRFLFAWPTGQYAVMGANQAAGTLLDINISALKRSIEPAETRTALITALEISTRHAEDEPFRTGVLQV
jgi:3-methylcrotonyl-CoA carboxylase beta subunit